MATKADFTEAEWEQMHNGVTGAGLLVSLSDRSFFDNFKEARAIAKHLNDARQHSDSLLVRDLAAEHGTGFSVRSHPDEIQAKTLDALRASVTLLQAKAPDDLDDYRRWSRSGRLWGAGPTSPARHTPWPRPQQRLRNSI
jgi:hypothetical protein